MRDLRNEMYSINEESSEDTILHTQSGEKNKLDELEERVKRLERDVMFLKGRHATLR